MCILKIISFEDAAHVMHSLQSLYFCENISLKSISARILKVLAEDGKNAPDTLSAFSPKRRVWIRIPTVSDFLKPARHLYPGSSNTGRPLCRRKNCREKGTGSSPLITVVYSRKWGLNLPSPQLWIEYGPSFTPVHAC